MLLGDHLKMYPSGFRYETLLFMKFMVATSEPNTSYIIKMFSVFEIFSPFVLSC